MEHPFRKPPLALLTTLVLAVSSFVVLAPARAANDELRQTAQAYAATVNSIDSDLNTLSAMDQKCITQDVVYDPKDLSSHSKGLARAFKGAEMAKMDSAVQALGQQLALGKARLDETVQRINSARDSMEKLTAGGALKTSGVDACNGGDAAQDKILAVSQAQVGSAKAILGLDSRAKKQPKISTIIETFKNLVSQKANQPEFSSLIKACTGPAFGNATSTLHSGLAKLGRLQIYAEGVEESVTKIGDSLSAQAAVMKKQDGCKSIADAEPKPAAAPASKSTITEKPAAAANTGEVAKPARAPAPVPAETLPAEVPKPAAKPAALTESDKPSSPSAAASERIASQGSVYTAGPNGVPAAEALAKCYADPCSRTQVRAYQTAINQYITQNNLPITPISTDGIAGTQTANAWRAVMGSYSTGNTSGSSYQSWGASQRNTPNGVYYTFPPAKITSPSQLENFFQ